MDDYVRFSRAKDGEPVVEGCELIPSEVGSKPAWVFSGTGVEDLVRSILLKWFDVSLVEKHAKGFAQVYLSDLPFKGQMVYRSTIEAWLRRRPMGSMPQVLAVQMFLVLVWVRFGIGLSFVLLAMLVG